MIFTNKKSIVLSITILTIILTSSINNILADEFDPGGGGSYPRYFNDDGYYFSNIFLESYTSSYDDMVISSTFLFDGLKDDYGHFDYIDKIYANLLVSLNPDRDYEYSSWWYWKEYSYVIDTVKISIKIQDPNGGYLTHDTVRGISQYYLTAGGSDNQFMIVLYDATIELTSGILPYPLGPGLKTLTNNLPNPLYNSYTDGNSDQYTHWWMFEYGLLHGESELGLQIIFSPTFKSYIGYYVINVDYEVKLKKLGSYGTGSFPGGIGFPFEQDWFTYTTQTSMLVIKDI